MSEVDEAFYRSVQDTEGEFSVRQCNGIHTFTEKFILTRNVLNCAEEEAMKFLCLHTYNLFMYI